MRQAEACSSRPVPLKVYCSGSNAAEHIEHDVASRSALLAGLFETGEEVVLPEEVTMQQFIVWRDAPAPESAASTRSTDLCNILTAADVLGDRFANSWEQLVVGYLMIKIVQEQRPFPQTLREQAAAALSVLPPHVWDHVVARVGREPFHLHRLLELMPCHQHTAILLATVSPAQEFAARLLGESTYFLKALAMAPASSRPILHLDLQCLPMPASTTLSEAAVALIAEAIKAQGSLLSLRLGSIQLEGSLSQQPYSSRDSDIIDYCPYFRKAASLSATLLAPAIASLTSLQTLSLGSVSDCFTLSDLPLTPTTLKSLPHLQHFKLFLTESPNLRLLRFDEPAAAPPEPFEKQTSRVLRQRSQSTPQAPAQICLASILSTCTALSSLHVHSDPLTWPYHVQDVIRPKSVVTATVPLHLPHLCHLNLTGASHSLAGPLLALLTAPLTALTVGDVRLPFTSVIDAPASTDNECGAAGALVLLRDIPTVTFPHLQRLHLDLPLWQRSASSSTSEAPPRHQDTPMLLQKISALAELPKLQEFSVTGSNTIHLHSAVSAVVAGSPALRHVAVACRGIHSGHELTQEALRGLLHALQTPQLSTLSIRLFDVPSGLPPSLGELLEAQPALTRLQLHWYRNCLASTEEVAALACLTALQHLDIHDFRPDPPLHEDLCRALQSLTALTELSLTQGGLHDSFVQQLVAEGAAWPVLRRLCLGREYMFTGPQILVENVGHFPALREAAFQDGHQVRLRSDVPIEATRTEARPRGPPMSGWRLGEAAAATGVRLAWTLRRLRGSCSCANCKKMHRANP